jgi:uncharacterized protein YceH (UPF0502 family)
MPPSLNDIEARILGSLVEKSLATPEQYPLSLKALTAACNQKTSREPVMELDEALVGKSLYPLIQRGLVEQRFELGSRVPKFSHQIHLLIKTQDPKVVGAACVLLLRGPQTPGEIKGRTERLCEFVSTAEAEALLQSLTTAEDPLVTRLPRQPGQKESRYRHLFSGPAAGDTASAEPSRRAPAESTAPPHATAPSASGDERIARLEKRVDALEAALKSLQVKT